MSKQRAIIKTERGLLEAILLGKGRGRPDLERDKKCGYIRQFITKLK